VQNPALTQEFGLRCGNALFAGLHLRKRGLHIRAALQGGDDQLVEIDRHLPGQRFAGQILHLDRGGGRNAHGAEQHRIGAALAAGRLCQIELGLRHLLPGLSHFHGRGNALAQPGFGLLRAGSPYPGLVALIAKRSDASRSAARQKVAFLA
jgi:hypothetical protein